jgi:hypothetical protein
MRLSPALRSGLVATSFLSLAAAAWAAGYDGVYVGKTKMTSQSYSATGSPVSCKREYDIKITVAGNVISGENLSIGGKATGTVQKDGSFTAKGGLSVQTQATVQGKIQGNTIRGTYSQMTRNATCSGTLAATRQ